MTDVDSAPRIGLIAEADGEIGFGHLTEIRSVARALHAAGAVTEIVGIGSIPPVHGWNWCKWVENLKAAFAFVAERHASATVWSLRRCLQEQDIDRLEHLNGPKVWLMDQPASLPPVDLLIIPTVVRRWYLKQDRAQTILFGPSFIPLDPLYSTTPVPLEKRTRDVLLTLGGADRTQVTLKLLAAIASFRSTVVIGPGFRHRAQVVDLATKLGVAYEVAPETIYPLLTKHRVVISSGGNTLYEAAAAGTPAFVVWEDPHEEERAMSLAAAGIAQVIGRGQIINVESVHDTIATVLNSRKTLRQMAVAGRRLVDGNGAGRVAKAILGLVSGKFSPEIGPDSIE